MVLLQPLIPHNTGAIGRTCVGLGASLHLIEPLGFRLDDAAVKRAGLDYWPKLDVTVHANWEAYADAELTLGRKAFLFTRLGRMESKVYLTLSSRKEKTTASPWSSVLR